MAAIDPILTALADPTRRRVVELLGDRPLRASELATRVGMGRPSMSRHLAVLRRSGLVEAETPDQDARARVYRLRGDRVEELEDWIGRVRTDWADQLARFARHLEEKA